ncbi:MAG: ABC transporter ATP-binding protein [Erysipelotrichaceae bacterium]|nr:ABC transporter ATP-binding protein [Erysipelotrichaceae bacterium]
MLKIVNISKGFNDKKVLKDLSLDIHDGKIFALVGVNGSGKTTLLRTVAGIYKADNGYVEFNGYDTYKDAEIRKDIFFVSDDPYYPFADNMKSLKMFYMSFYDFDENEFDKYVSLFSLDTDKNISTFSKGMKRQAMLCYALAIKPKLLILDEAFDGLDPMVRKTLKKTLSDFVMDNNSTIIISSHNLKELEDICDEFGMLEDGKISTYGDLLEEKQSINKYQLAFKDEIDESVFDQFDILHKEKEGSVYTLVIKGDKDEIRNRLRELNPAIMDILNINFEEMFIYEHEGER